MSDFEEWSRRVPGRPREELWAELQEFLLHAETLSAPDWRRHSIFSFGSALMFAIERPEADHYEALAQREFEQLVPETMTRAEFAENLARAVTQCPGLADFKLQDVVVNQAQLADALWLESGYHKWVNLELPYEGATSCQVVVGGSVDSVREMYHHDEGYPPFHVLWCADARSAAERPRSSPEAL